MNSEQVCIRTTINNTRKRGEPPIRKPHRDDTWSYGRFAHCSNYIIIQYIISYSYFVLYYHSIVYIWYYLFHSVRSDLTSEESPGRATRGAPWDRRKSAPRRYICIYMCVYIYIYIYIYIVGLCIIWYDIILCYTIRKHTIYI